ncbi:calmodulin-4-like [Patiria miniata]|uniref:EF-hand domain-containing protein n=1 Tax=Patiria miniata TaxID=46514 RepID=A0A913ZBP5_PATMI|nr:calmodulin-4-like [Patiria miniata]
MSAHQFSGLSVLRLFPALMLLFLPVFTAMPRQKITGLGPVLQKRVAHVQLGAPSHTELFGMYDVDSDGFLEPVELMLLLQRPDQVNAVDEFVHKLKTVLTISETNGDGKLDISEFTEAVSGDSRAPKQVEASGAFELFDENGDQILNYTEVVNAIQRMTGTAPSRDLVEQMFASTDANSDGAIDEIEFARAMQVNGESEIHIK